MIHRMLPCVLALVLGATPVARMICDVSCSAPGHASTAAGHEHHGAAHSASTTHATHMHESSESESSTVMGASLSATASPLRHGCERADEWRATAAPKQVLTAPAVVAQSHDAPPCPEAAARRATVTALFHPAIPLPLRTPLRI